MNSFKLPHFGILDLDSLNEYYEAEIDFNNTTIQVDLNFEGKSIQVETLDVLKQFIENIRIHDINNKKFIQSDFESSNEDSVKDYIQDHLDELPLDEVEDLIGSNIKSADRPEKLLKKLHLIRVGLYPHSKEFAVFDYSIGKELTNYFVVVNTDENGNLDYIAIES